MLKYRSNYSPSFTNFPDNQRYKMAQKDILFQISGRTLGWIVVPLPLGALLTCILWSIIYDFEASTATHCKV